MPSLNTVIRSLAGALVEAQLCTPEEAQREAGLVVGEALGLSRLEVLNHLEASLSLFSKAERLQNVSDRRLRGEPLSRIRGTRPFWKSVFRLSEHTLDPRPETEGLVERAIAWFRDKTPPRTIVDLGTGTGCVLLSLLQEFPQALGIAVDLSHGALKTARENSLSLELENRCVFVQTSWMAGLEGPFDLIVSNPPYIPSADIAELAPEVRCFDPLCALDGGGSGIAAYQDLTPQVAQSLTSEGLFLFEMGRGQHHLLQPFLEDWFRCISFAQDWGGIVRYGCCSSPKRSSNE